MYLLSESRCLVSPLTRVACLLPHSALRIDNQQRTMAYEPRRILLTGGAGFIASHVALQLVERYPAYEVSCYKNKARKCANAQNIGHRP